MAKIARTLGALVAGALAISACGSGNVLGQPDDIAGNPMIQIHSEGGFVPVEWNLGNGPTFTVTYDGEFIFPGVTTLEYPGKLLPPYMVGDLSEEEMETIRGYLEEMGLAGIEDEHDGSVDKVADASTEVIRYWDDGGVHRYSVYALGISDRPVSETTAAFAELFEYLHQLSASVGAAEYTAESVQVIAGADYVGPDPDFVDIRDWPLEGENPDDWDELTTVGDSQVWTCKVFDGSVLTQFADATQVTLWMHPNESADAQNFKLLVRPILPGEEGCTL